MSCQYPWPQYVTNRIRSILQYFRCCHCCNSNNNNNIINNNNNNNNNNNHYSDFENVLINNYLNRGRGQGQGGTEDNRVDHYDSNENNLDDEENYRNENKDNNEYDDNNDDNSDDNNDDNNIDNNENNVHNNDINNSSNNSVEFAELESGQRKMNRNHDNGLIFDDMKIGDLSYRAITDGYESSDRNSDFEATFQQLEEADNTNVNNDHVSVSETSDDFVIDMTLRTGKISDNHFI